MRPAERAPHAVVFDLGKVLVDFDYGRAASRLAAHAAASTGEIRRLLDQTPLLHEYETGLMSTDQFRQAVSAGIGFTGSTDQFDRFFTDIFTPVHGMVALLDELVRRGIPTFAFSNTNELAIRHIRRTYPFFGKFTDAVLSYEEGAMKPAERIYLGVEQRSWKRGADLLYIDDRLENVEQARQRGWNTIHHVDAAATAREVRGRFGLE